MRILIVALFLSAFNTLYCCSCKSTTTELPIREIGLSITSEETNKDSLIIFEGILIDTMLIDVPGEHSFVLIYEVTDVYLGECLDTIEIYTNSSSSSCGFITDIGYYAIIKGMKNRKGQWKTYRQDCWKGVSSHNEKNRFEETRAFLISIKYKIDGEYHFRQLQDYWQNDMKTKNYVPQLTYKITNRKLNGLWQIHDRSGMLIETGEFRDGVRFGEWKFVENIDVWSFDYNYKVRYFGI